LHIFLIYVHQKRKNMKKLAIFASGEGTNAERIAHYFVDNETIEIGVVLTNKENAGVIKRAEKLRLPVEIVPSQAFKEGKVSKLMRQYEIDFIVLAGFLLRIPEELLHEYPNKIVNIHPSLLPKYGGKGMYGIHVHEAVLAAQETESGITIHYIDEHYDEGDVILQVKCPVLPTDTPETLASRVHQLEYEHYPIVIDSLLKG